MPEGSAIKMKKSGFMEKRDRNKKTMRLGKQNFFSVMKLEYTLLPVRLFCFAIHRSDLEQ